MNWTSAFVVRLPTSIQPSQFETSAQAKVIAIATVNPMTSVFSEVMTRCQVPRSRPKQMAATAPNSGPSTIAPTIRMGEFCRMPMPASCVAMARKARYAHVMRESACTRCASSSQTTASSGSPGASSTASVATLDSDRSTCSMAMEPSVSSHLSRSSTSLADSRAASQRITSPAGSRATPGRTTMLVTPGQSSSTVVASSVRAGGLISRRCSTEAIVVYRTLMVF